MADTKLLGTLQLSLGTIEATVNKANKALQKLGQGIDLDLTQIANDKIEKSLSQLIKAAEKYGKKMGEAGQKAKTSMSAMTSSIVNTSSIKTIERMGTATQKLITGFDSAGHKIRETFVEGKGIVSKQTLRDLEAGTKELERYKKAQEDLHKSQAKEAQTKELGQVRELVSLYKELGAAESKYLAADTKGNQQELDYWGKRIDTIQESIKQLERQNPALKENAQVMEAKRKAEEQAALAMAKSSDAQEKLNAKQRDANTPLKQSEQLYKDLSKAIQDYNKAMKAGDTDSADVFKGNIENMRGQLEGLKSTLASMSPNDPGYSQLATNIARAETAMAGFGREAQSAADSSNKIGESIMTWMSRMIMYRGLRQMWSEAKNFATDYYATLNEIQVVTMKSDSQVQAMAKNFTSMSQDLRVPLTDIASAATIFYRQGLNDEQVNERLEAITKFSKISGTSIEDASQYFTAVLNSFDELEGNAQRVSDVFTYIGKQHCRLVA